MNPPGWKKFGNSWQYWDGRRWLRCLSIKRQSWQSYDGGTKEWTDCPPPDPITYPPDAVYDPRPAMARIRKYVIVGFLALVIAACGLYYVATSQLPI